MKIGNYTFSHGLVLAPMAGVTDSAFRQMCKSFGAELVVSEMISAKGLHYADKKTNALAAYRTPEQPIAMQLFGSDPDIMAEAAQKLCTLAMPPQIIDVNMGCPMRKIVSNGDGSALMQNPKLAATIIRKMTDAVKIPVTVKFRTGWDEFSINAVTFAKEMEAAGAAAITIHGRTRTQLYAPPIDYTTIGAVANAVQIPVIGNGGIHSVADAERMFSLGCSGIALARGACGKPWLFADIIAARNGIAVTEKTMRERIEIAKAHVDLAIQEKGSAVAIREMRWHLAQYIYGMHGAASARDAINHTTDKDTVFAILDNLVER